VGEPDMIVQGPPRSTPGWLGVGIANSVNVIGGAEGPVTIVPPPPIPPAFAMPAALCAPPLPPAPSPPATSAPAVGDAVDAPAPETPPSLVEGVPATTRWKGRRGTGTRSAAGHAARSEQQTNRSFRQNAQHASHLFPPSEGSVRIPVRMIGARLAGHPSRLDKILNLMIASGVGLTVFACGADHEGPASPATGGGSSVSAAGAPVVASGGRRRFRMA